MITIAETAALLREMAEDLEVSRNRLLLPTEHADIQGTAEELRLILGPHAYFSIRLDLDYPREGPATVGWCVYDGSRSYEGPRLCDALNALRESLTPKIQGDPIESIRLAETALDPLPL